MVFKLAELSSIIKNFKKLSFYYKVSGLSDWIGSQFSTFSGSRKEVLLIISQIVSAIATEFTSNVSIASVFIPLFDTLVNNINYFVFKSIAFFSSLINLI